MFELLKVSLDDTLGEMKNDFSVAPIEAWNESVFRFIFCKNINKRNKEINQLVECNRIDLVLRGSDFLSFIEFKFYIHSNKFDPCTQQQRGRKSFPSPNNFNEFKKSIEILKNREGTKLTSKFIILFYADPDPCKSAVYDFYYNKQKINELKKFEPLLTEKYRIEFDLTNSKNNILHCNAVIYELEKVLTPEQPEGT